MQDSLKARAEYIDSTYSVENHKNYRLSIQLRLDGFSFAIFSVETKHIVKLQEFRTHWNKEVTLEEKWNKINQYFLDTIEKDSLAFYAFQSIKIIIDHKEYHAEAKIYAQHKKSQLAINFNQEIKYSNTVCNKEAIGSDSVISFALPSYLNSTIMDHFEEAKIIHISNVILNDIRILHQNKTLGKRIYVYISDRDIHIIAYDNELIFSNAFTYSAKEDFIYFILLAFDQLHMNPDNDPLYFMGEISHSSALYNITWQYIRNIHFMGNQLASSLSTDFDLLPIHQYYLLLQSNLCE